ncbi:CopD family protein [Arenimonas sp. MALMAid1274]|uniref:CopD family protein n=1 Tax=Arenimonas sp. MALMAid1274 TaxID=3411630 RepID=UPI003BA3C9A3
MAAYFWTKTFHLVFVIAWMATVFYLPRILVNLAETRGQADVQARLVLMGRRLYGFGHSMFGIAVVLGLLLWLGHKLSPELWPDIVAGMKWMHAKLTLVAALLAYFIVAGRWLKRAAAGGTLPSPTTMRWFNELPLLALVPIIWLVLAKPF